MIEDEIEDNEIKSFLCVGLTGNFLSGKTTVAKILSSLGYKVISTDNLAKEIMNSNQTVKKSITEKFGKESYNDNGELNSKFLAGIVFADNTDGNKSIDILDSIVHPPVIEEMISLVDNYEESGEKLIFVESALIFEAELDEGFDYIINVAAPMESILKRAELRGFTREEALHRLSRQMSPEEKSRYSDFTIENKGSEEELKNSTEFIVNLLKCMVE